MRLVGVLLESSLERTGQIVFRITDEGEGQRIAVSRPCDGHRTACDADSVGIFAVFYFVEPAS